MARTDAPSLRQAALLLHSLPDSARQHVLSRLPEPDVSALRESLDELVELGIPAEQQWVAEVREPKASASNPDSARAAGTRAINGPVALLALQDQSVETAAALLQGRTEPWAAFVLDSWPADTRHRLRSLAQSNTAVPAPVATILNRAFEQRVLEIETAANRSVGTTRQRGSLLKSLTAWLTRQT